YAGRSCSYDFFQNKLSLLHLRYKTLEKVLEEPYITWNEETKRMAGRREDWKKIIWENPFAKTYYYFGEPKWEQMRKILGGAVLSPFRGTNTNIDEGNEDGSDGSGVIFLRVKSYEEPEVVDLVTSEDEC
ncbi:UNVERIFIED_CONTAM: hypothetical protein Sindi_2684100, partial [Sesamum indicum]